MIDFVRRLALNIMDDDGMSELARQSDIKQDKQDQKFFR